MNATDFRVIDGGKGSPKEPAPTEKLFSIEAECALLGNVIYDGDKVLVWLPDKLTPDKLYLERHRQILAAAVSLRAQQKHVDLLSVREVLRDNGTLASVQAGYLVELTDYVALESPKRLEELAETIVACWARRELRTLGSQLSAQAEHATGPPAKVISAAKKRLEEIDSATAGDSHEGSPAALCREAVASIRACAEGIRNSVASGFKDLDSLVGGMRAGDLTVLGGRPGMGKTSLASMIAFQSAERGEGVFVSSLETKTDFMIRALATKADCRADRLMRGEASKDEWSRVISAATSYAPLPIWIDHEEGLTVARLWAKCRKQQLRLSREKRRLSLVVIDYLQLLVQGRPGFIPREQVVAENCRALKAMAGELGVAVLALAQLNRGVEKNGKDKRPQLSDLRESGEIEQCARMVWLLYRGDYYERGKRDLTGEVEIDVAKNNNGPTGRVRLLFDAPKLRFSDAPPAWDDGEPYRPQDMG